MNQINDAKEYILSNLQIEDIISEYLSISKQGRNYIAVCPFHNDTNPSLSISVNMQFFNCFVCNAKGNLISFVMRYKNISYVEAIKLLAKKAGYKLNDENNSKSASDILKEKLYTINEDALNWFQLNLMLKDNKKIRDYLLNDRKLQFENIDEFKIGYAPKNSSLCEFLRKNYRVTDIEKASLINEKNDNIIDFFNDRIIFSICDVNNKIIGFSGRSLNSKSNAKYLNTRTNIIFAKNKQLYNINNAIDEIRKKQTVIIVEGYLDVIALHNKGIKNVVCAMGTALCNEHIATFSQIAKNIILFFDGDKAGINANIKNATFLLKNNFNIKIVNNITKYDPDELCQKDFKKLNNMLESPIDIIDYLTSHIKLDSDEEIKNFIIIRDNLLNSIKDNTIKYLTYKNRLNDFIESKIPGYKVSDINDVNIIETPEQIPFQTQNNNLFKDDGLFRDLIKQLLLSNKTLEILKKDITIIDFSKSSYAECFQVIFDIYTEYPKIKKIDNNFLIDYLKSKELLKLSKFFNEIYELIIQINLSFNEKFLLNIIDKFRKLKDKNKVISIIKNDYSLQETNEMLKKYIKKE